MSRSPAAVGSGSMCRGSIAASALDSFARILM
jgi:hypothetical protein